MISRSLRGASSSSPSIFRAPIAIVTLGRFAALGESVEAVAEEQEVSLIADLRDGFRAKASLFPLPAYGREILARGSAGVLAVASGTARRDETLGIDPLGLLCRRFLAGVEAELA